MVFVLFFGALAVGFLTGAGVEVLTQNTRAAFDFGVAAGMTVFTITAAIFLSRR